MPRWLVGAIVLLGLPATVVATRQQAQQPPTFRSNVELVQVDVVVLDKDGNPVRGLTRTDFTVLDRGKPQAIATFDELSHTPDAPAAVPTMPLVRLDVANNRSAQSDRLIMLVIDDLHIWKGRTDRAKQIARDVLSQLGPQSSMAVLFTSGDHNIQVTADQALLAAAVDTLKGRQSVRRPHPAIDEQRPGHIDPEMSADQQLSIISASQQTKTQDFFDNMAQYKTIENAAKLLGSATQRRKAFVLLSEGIGKDLTGIFGAMAAQGDVPQGGSAYASGDLDTYAASSMSTVPPFHSTALIEMMEAMRRSDVATYAIDPRGAVGSGDLRQECFPPPPGTGDDPCSDGLTDFNSIVRQAQQGLGQISQASGGFAVTNTNDFTGGLQKIVNDLDHYYLLGFYPADTNGKNYRRLNVTIAGHPDWTLRFRHGYQPGGAPPAPKNADPMAALSAGVMPNRDLPLRLSAIALPTGSNTAHVEYSLEVSASVRDLQEPDRKVRDTLHYELLVVDEKKAKVTSVSGLEGRLTLSPHPGAGPPPDTIAYQVNDGVDLPPGRYQFRVSATSAKLATGGSVYLDVDVPSFSDPVAIGGIALGYASGPRVPVAPPATVPANAGRSARPNARGPVSRPAGPVVPFAPTLDREFSRGDMLRVYVPGAVRDQQRHAKLTLEIVDAAKTVVSSEALPFADGHGETTLPLTDLAPGPYRLRATLDDGVHTVAHEVGFAVK